MPAPAVATATPPQARLLAAGPASPEAEAAAGFISRTLASGGDHYVYPESTWFDGGNTIDAIIALDAVGSEPAQSDSSFAFLEANVGGYIGTDYDSLYAGPTAKTLLGVLSHGGDPSAFGGLDLVEELQASEGAVEPGRFSDLPVDCGFSECDYSNTIGQSLALIALSRAGEPLSTASVEVLLDQQCSDGGFRGTIGGGTCVTDADATAFAVQALIAAGRTLLCGTGTDGLPARVTAASAAALDRLEALQGPSGGLVSDDGVANANTTGVAGQAFIAGGRTAAAASATTFIASLQYDATAPESLRGGIAFSADSLSTTTPSDSDLRATPQATLALSGLSLVDTAADGVQMPAPVTTCPPVRTPPASEPPPSSGGSEPGATGAQGSDADDDAAAGVATGPTGSLAQTGSDLLAPVGLGLALVLVGAIAVAASRRRGAHA
ncbi:MAG TPA: hypothetical protein VFI47_25575 [Acidimicrobiales bacterium]|nr:hypothetical protein [Acidimicrobiales bacterium]